MDAKRFCVVFCVVLLLLTVTGNPILLSDDDDITDDIIYGLIKEGAPSHERIRRVSDVEEPGIETGRNTQDTFQMSQGRRRPDVVHLSAAVRDENPSGQQNRDVTRAPSTVGDTRPADNETKLWQLAHDLGLNEFSNAVLHANMLPLLTDTVNYTLLAPTDEAFLRLPEFVQLKMRTDQQFLIQFMRYHLVQGNLPGGDLSDNQLVRSLAFEKIASFDNQYYYIRFNKYKLPDSQVTSASGCRIESFDHEATNGRIHIIDGAMFPLPNVTVLERVSIMPSLRMFESLLKAADLPIDQLDGFTVFAPTQKAFSNIPSAVVKKLLSDRKLLRNILSRHVVKRPLFKLGLYEQQTILTYNNDSLLVIKGPGGIDLFINHVFSHIETADLTSIDGILHTVDTLLWNWQQYFIDHMDEIL